MDQSDFSDFGEDDPIEDSFPTDKDSLPVVNFGTHQHLTGWKKTKLKQQQKKVKPGSFGSMGLSEQMLHNVHKRMKFNLPTPIQRKTIPLILQGLDVVGMARTGSGKTAAFVIPMLERLKEHSTKVGARAVIMSPTRELSLQTFSVVQKLGYGMNLRTAVLVGGDSMMDQFQQLAANPDVLIATPGRLGHILVEVKDFSLKSVIFIVFDEADRLFEMGFADQIQQIVSAMGTNRQTLLFSATLPRVLAEFTSAGLHDPEVVRLDAETQLSPDLRTMFFTVRIEDKPTALFYLLREVLSEKSPTLIFVSTKHHVDFLAHLLQQDNIGVAYAYGAMDQAARKIQVAKFRSKVVNILIVTDVAARGIDLPLIDNVVHYDFPATPKLFVHRSGRAARAGRSGSAYSMLTKDEIPYLLDLHLYLSRPIEPVPIVLGEDLMDGPDEAVYGTFPPEEVGALTETMRFQIQSSEVLQRLQRSINNGFRLYCKSRPPASTPSCKRAKLLAQEGCHPYFLRMKTGNNKAKLQAELDRAAFTEQLKNFRPSAAVFTEKVSENRSKLKRKYADPAGVSELSQDLESDVVAQTRKPKATRHDGPRAENSPAADRKKLDMPVIGELNQGRYKDANFYIEHQRQDHYAEASLRVHGDAKSKLDSAVMDMMGEDQSGVMNSKRRYHWQKRGRKFVQLPSNETVKTGKRVKIECGAKITEKKGTAGVLYKKWVQNSHNRISTPGSLEDSRVTKALRRGALDGASIVYRHKKGGDVANPDAKDELKNVDQVRKTRKIKARNKERSKPRKDRIIQKGTKGTNNFRNAKRSKHGNKR